MIFKGNFSTNVLSTVKNVIHFVQQVARYDLYFSGSVHLDARPNHARKVISPFRHSQFRATSCTLRFMISCVAVHLDARPNQARNELKCGNFWRYFFNQRIINRQARYSFRATSCTLRFYKKIQKLCVNHRKYQHLKRVDYLKFHKK